MKRFLCAVGFGLAMGASFTWFVEALPHLLGTVLILVFVAVILWWALRQLRWARRMARELSADDGDQDSHD